jgi:hypothetical protein
MSKYYTEFKHRMAKEMAAQAAQNHQLTPPQPAPPPSPDSND